MTISEKERVAKVKHHYETEIVPNRKPRIARPDLDLKKPCLEWQKSCHEKGYGTSYKLGLSRYVHVVVLEHHLGRSLKNGLFSLHRCDNPACSEITHLREGTSQENSTDMAVKGRGRKGKTSIYRGVSSCSRRKRWQSGLTFNGKRHSLGRFENEIEAAKAVDKKTVELYGYKHPPLNFEPIPAISTLPELMRQLVQKRVRIIKMREATWGSSGI